MTAQDVLDEMEAARIMAEATDITSELIESYVQQLPSGFSHLIRRTHPRYVEIHDAPDAIKLAIMYMALAHRYNNNSGPSNIQQRWHALCQEQAYRDRHPI